MNTGNSLVTIITENIDISTHKVIGWLLSMNKRVLRINDEMFIEKLIINNKEMIINNLDILNCFIVWERRGNLRFKLINNEIPKGIFEILGGREWSVVRDYIFFIIEQKGIASLKHETSHNKLIDLHIANKSGFQTPNSFIICEKEKLIEIAKKYQLITKPLKDPLNIEHNGYKYKNVGTKVIESTDIDDVSELFFPMLLQEKIDKLFEIRVFYWLEKCYSMAIFSQLDTQTSIDYRNYNKENPNRNIPFQLPEKVEQQIHAFMKMKGMKTGSLDIIYSKTKKFIFLEVNPCGQFDWLSGNCNYYIEKKIAKSLVEYEN